MDDWRDKPITASEVLVDGWLQRLECAVNSDDYKAFKAVSKVCYSFYKNSAKFMWEEKFRKEYIGDIDVPRFEITINKAFEYVAIFGPYLFWDYPNRKVMGHDPLNFGIGAFGNPEDPTVQFIYEQIQTGKVAEKQRRDARCTLMSAYLNYSQREQENGLTIHSRLAIQDALIKGRGVLVPRTYSHPGSGRTLTELRYVSVDRLRIDPDCHDPLLKTATWVALRHCETTREVERRFRLKRGTLKDAGNLASHESIAGMNGRKGVERDHMASGKSNDQIVWYEIWSKCGVGGWDDNGKDSELIRAMDDVVGDYAYLCVSANVPWLLNAPPEAMEDATDEDVQEMLGWPFPCYMDGRWPMALLDFYHDSEGPWPVAPLSAALGELICMNVLTAAFVEQAYENRKSIIAVLDEAAKDFEEALSGNKSPVVAKMKGDLGKTIDQMISFIDRPGMNKDILSALEWVVELFNLRTGMVPFMYGSEQKVSRSAQDIAAKQERTSIRPEKMAKDVAAWQTEAATLEKFLACLYVQGKDIRELVGDDGAMLWDSLIYGEDPEKVVRELTCFVEATDVARPNRERDLSNLQTLAQQVFPMYMEYSRDTGDTSQLSQYLKQTMEAMQQPSEGLELGPWNPRPDPMAAQEAEAAAAAEQAKTEAVQQKAQVDIAVKEADIQAKQQQMQLDLFKTQAEMEMDAEQHQQEMAFSRQKSELDLSLALAEGRQGIMLNRIQGAEKIQGMKEQNKAKVQMAKQKPKAASNGKK